MSGTRALGRRRVAALALFVVLHVFSFPQVLPWVASPVEGGTLFAVLAFAALLVGIEGLAPGRAFRVGFAASLIAHLAIFHWFAVATIVHGGMTPWLGALAPLLPAAFTATFSAGFAALFASVPARHVLLPILAAVTFTGVEQLRAVVLGGFGWASPGYAAWQNTALLGLSQTAGVHAMTFVIALCGAALARFVSFRRLDAGASAGFIAALVLIGVGAVLSASPTREGETIRVAAIQGNIDQREKWSEARLERNLDRYLRLSLRAAAAGAELIVWPETAVPGFFEVDPRMREPIEALARKSRASFVIGGAGVAVTPLPDGDRLDAIYDSAFVIDGAGHLLDRYDKTKLVPFGEFVPLRSWFGEYFEALARGLSSRDLTAGAAPRSVEVPFLSRDEPLRVGVPICYELVFPDAVRRMPADGAGLLLGITNDAWYGRTGARPQFLAITAVRAAEARTPLVRAANTGISAIIDERGRVRKQSRWDVQDVLVGDISPLPRGGARSIYARYGDLFAWACAAGAILLAVGRAASTARERKRETGDRPR